AIKLPLKYLPFEQGLDHTNCHGVLDALLTRQFPARSKRHLDWANKAAELMSKASKKIRRIAEDEIGGETVDGVRRSKARFDPPRHDSPKSSSTEKTSRGAATPIPDDPLSSSSSSSSTVSSQGSAVSSVVMDEPWIELTVNLHQLTVKSTEKGNVWDSTLTFVTTIVALRHWRMALMKTLMMKYLEGVALSFTHHSIPSPLQKLIVYSSGQQSSGSL
ncbi:hypothetical protein BGZ83_002819, partial [Gryganskiella cystojenkinii]